jgi:hypothetical protein
MVNFSSQGDNQNQGSIILWGLLEEIFQRPIRLT